MDLAAIAAFLIYCLAAGYTFFVLDTGPEHRPRRHDPGCWEVACPGCAGTPFTVNLRTLISAWVWPLLWLGVAGAGIDRMVRRHYENRPQGADK